MVDSTSDSIPQAVRTAATDSGGQVRLQVLIVEVQEELGSGVICGNTKDKLDEVVGTE